MRDLRSRAFILSLLLLIVGQCALAQADRAGQSRPGQQQETETLSDERRVSTSPGQSWVTPKGVALESVIDPQKYVVGPSDVFSVNIWRSPTISLLLTVTPEGTLIVPYAGEVTVADLTLAEAKRRVVAEIRKKYLLGDITVTLVTPRPIVVAVTGSVLNPGSYALTASSRADKAIAVANPQDSLRVLPPMSKRNIRLRRKDGSSMQVDILRFYATKEERWNPYLREGDVIAVPRPEPTSPIVGVYGEVNLSGQFEFVPGDSVKDLLLLAYGFTSRALADSIEFTRLDIKGESIVTRWIDGAGILSGKVENIALEPGDRIVVRAKPDMRRDYQVSVSGEVIYPGVYPITKQRTRLTEIISRAGGFTGMASLESAEVYRHSSPTGSFETDRLMGLRGNFISDDAENYRFETEVRLRREVVSVNFEKLFLRKDTTQDIVLQSGDSIAVPSRKTSVYVFGQVVAPGHVSFLPNQDVEYYIRKAGGFTEVARSGDVKIVKDKTRQWISPKETTIEPGDYIWVPREPDRPFIYYMTIYSQAASILSVIIGLAVVVGIIKR